MKHLDTRLFGSQLKINYILLLYVILLWIAFTTGVRYARSLLSSNSGGTLSKYRFLTIIVQTPMSYVCWSFTPSPFFTPKTASKVVVNYQF